MTIAAMMLILLVAPASTPTEQTRPEAAASGPVLLDFHAEWCGPCRTMRSAVAKLIKGGYPVKSIDIDQSPKLAARYQVERVPCFIVVDEAGRVLDRVEGAQPASQLATLYNRSAQALEAKVDVADQVPERRVRGVSNENEADPKYSPKTKNPKPWQTVVRIKVSDGGLVGFGSGTIIHSTSEESIILSCAHIFKVRGPVASPKQFKSPVSVDLFDGKITGSQPARVHFANESFKAEVIDYDFGKDVSLIRIRPGRKLPASRVVPVDWAPQKGLAMIAVGCPEGQDATAWDTEIVTPKLGLDNGAGYEGMGCRTAPKQGRSGGGLYTPDFFLAGVCDFAEPKGNVGLYATPKSIHGILDRNQMMALYERPTDPDRKTMLAANNRPKTRADQARPPVIARAQSPDPDETADVSIPPPEFLGIRSPGEDRRSSPTTRMSSPSRKPVAESGEDRAWTTELRRAPADSEDQLLTDDREEEAPLIRQNPPIRTKSKWRSESSDF